MKLTPCRNLWIAFLLVAIIVGCMYPLLFPILQTSKWGDTATPLMFSAWLGVLFFSGVSLLYAFLCSHFLETRASMITWLACQKPKFRSLLTLDRNNAWSHPLLWLLVFVMVTWGNSLIIENFPGGVGDYLRRLESEYRDLFLPAMEAPKFLIRALLSIALATGLAEELLFRGAIQTLLHRYYPQSPKRVVAIVAVIFAVAHFNLAGFLPILAMGVLLGVIRYRSSSIALGVVIHIVYNAFVLMHNV